MRNLLSNNNPVCECMSFGHVTSSITWRHNLERRRMHAHHAPFKRQSNKE